MSLLANKVATEISEALPQKSTDERLFREVLTRNNGAELGEELAFEKLNHPVEDHTTIRFSYRSAQKYRVSRYRALVPKPKGGASFPRTEKSVLA